MSTPPGSTTPLSATPRRTRDRIALVVLLMVLFAAIAARVSFLGDKEFMTDELNHHYAAQSLAKGAGPALPSGEAYERGATYTQFVRLSQRFSDRAETAARIPAAAFSVVAVVLFALICRLLAGTWPAVWATALLAIDPEILVQSKTSRFYTYQLALGVFALFTGWLASRPLAANALSNWAVLVRQWLWILATLLLFWLAYSVQVTTLSVMAAWLVFAMAVGMSAIRGGAMQAFRWSAPLQFTVLAVAAVVVLLVANPALPSELWAEARFVPFWAGGRAGPFLSYYYALVAAYGWMLPVLPLIAYAAWRRQPSLAMYLIVWFAVPLFLHSVFFAWKEMRFVLLSLPAFFLLAGLALTEVLTLVRQQTQLTLRRWGFSLQLAPRIAAIPVVLAACTAFLSIPALDDWRRYLVGELPNRTPRWQEVGRVLAQLPDSLRFPVGSSDPLSSFYYWKQVDFGVQLGLFDTAVRPSSRLPVLLRPPASDTLSRDFYTGVPLLTGPAAIRENFASYGGVLIGVDQMRANAGNVNRELLDTLRRDATDLCAQRCGAMHLYLWKLR